MNLAQIVSRSSLRKVPLALALHPRTEADTLNFREVMVINRVEGTKMRELCVRAPEYLGCYELPYEVGSGGEEIKFEGGLLKVSTPTAKGLEQKIIYRPLA